jgi:hypothetical protein
MNWKQYALAGLAVLGGLALLQYVRGQGGVVGAVMGGDIALKRFLAGPKAVAEAAKANQMGEDKYRDKKASESMVKS